MPDRAHLVMRLAPQEMDRLVSVLYDGLGQGDAKVAQTGTKDPVAVHKIYYNLIKDQLGSIEDDLVVNNLAGKFDIESFLNQALGA